MLLHVRFLEGLMDKRRNGAKATLELVKQLLTQAPEHFPFEDTSAWDFEIFGSRRYGTALPSSDLDVVGLFRNKSLCSKTSVWKHLDQCLHQLADLARKLPMCRNVQDVIQKKTVSFTCMRHRVDVTLGVVTHVPLNLSLQVKGLLDSEEGYGPTGSSS